jgi:hypothetical protein
MLFLYILESIYAISFWITGLIVGFLLAHVLGLDIKSSCIFFSGIRVLLGAILGKKAIIHTEQFKDEI